MKISLVTDEISADPETAFELGVQWGVQNFELRGFESQRVPFLTDFQKQRLKELLDEFGVRIIAISPGLFKIPWPAQNREHFPLRSIDVQMYQHWHDAKSLVEFHRNELLLASLEYAHTIGVDKIIIFSFHRGGCPPAPAPDEVLVILEDAAGQAEKAGIQLCMEVEDQFWGDTGHRAAHIVGQVHRSGLGINWDPGNALVAGEIPYPGGYQAVREFVRHVHFKDVKQDASGFYHYVVKGEIDWAGQIRALKSDNYSGYISIETHMQPKIYSAQESLKRLKRLIGETFEKEPKDEGD